MNYTLAKVYKQNKDLIFLKLLDTSPSVRICSLPKESLFKPKKGEIYQVELTNKTIKKKAVGLLQKKIDLEDENYDLERIINKHLLPGQHPNYPELDSLEKNVEPNELKNRKNLKNLFAVTIDGAEAKDFDDAISLLSEENKYTLYVHIADVSAYIPKGSLIDEEASKRTTSFYLGNYVIPMLPPKLSNDLCSLRADLPRLTMTVEIEFSLKGEILRTDFYRSIIKVNQRLTYEQATDLLQSSQSDQLNKTLKKMEELSQLLLKKRLRAGRLDLDVPNYELVYKKNRVVNIELAKRLPSHTIIEEFMLTANQLVAKILQEKSIPTLYRVHEKISQDSLRDLQKFLAIFNIKLAKAKNNGKSLQQIINKVQSKKESKVINFAILTSLMQADYRPKPLGHFALAFKHYTHFTSPIRRYSDLIVHRCLKSLLDKAPPPYSLLELSRIGADCSELERVAQRAERDLMKMKSCRIMEKYLGQIFPGIITGISKAGFFIALDKLAVEGMVPLRLLTDDYYAVQEDKYRIKGRKQGKIFTLGDKIDVRLTKVELENMRIDFLPA